MTFQAVPNATIQMDFGLWYVSGEIIGPLEERGLNVIAAPIPLTSLSDDLNHAIQLISQSPGVKLNCGSIEIRPAADINEIIKKSEQRRRKTIMR